MIEMFVHDHWKQFEPVGIVWHMLLASIYLIVTVFAVIANVMVVYYIIRIKKNKLTNGSAYFILNLAIADIFKVIIDLPMIAISSFNQKWMFGQIGCDFYGITSGLFGFVSIITLAFMSVERFFIVQDPFKSSGFGKKLKLGCILLGWVYAFILVFLQLFSAHGYILEGFLTSCSFDYLSRDIFSRVLMLILITFGFFFPLMVIFVFYAMTKHRLRKTNSNLCNNLAESLNPSSSMFYTITRLLVEEKSSQHSTYVTQTTKKSLLSSDSDVKRDALMSINQKKNFRTILNREYRVLKTIILNVSLFCLAWTPYAIVAMLGQFGANIDLYLNPYATALPGAFAKISSVYNPVLYTLSNRECRAYFRQIYRNKT